MIAGNFLWIMAGHSISSPFPELSTYETLSTWPVLCTQISIHLDNNLISHPPYHLRILSGRQIFPQLCSPTLTTGLAPFSPLYPFIYKYFFLKKKKTRADSFIVQE